MTSSRPDYSPPSTAVILSRQNETTALRYLTAQRRLYSRAKRWLAIRWVGFLVIGIGAPVASVIWPPCVVAAGAIAGIWLFLGRTLLVFLQNSTTTRAAAVQEQFDFYVFAMPDNANRSVLPSLEDIARIAGPDDKLDEVARKEDLLDWYPLDQSDSGTVSVAISQRANASYTDSLLRTTAVIWAIVVALWVIGLIAVGIILKIELSAFLLGIIFPVLPAFLDVVQYVSGVRRSAGERRDLARAIERKVDGSDGVVDAEDLLVWQERMFDLRRSSPEVPNFVYKMRRSGNERAMNSAARELGRKARGTHR